MGNYATTTSLATVMPDISFDTATTALVSELIDQAETEVNKYLSRRYDLSSSYFQTTTSIPPLVRTLTKRLAEGYTWKAMSRGAKESLKRGQVLEDGVIKNLELIQNYQSDLSDTAGAVIPDFTNTAMRVKCNTSTYRPTFDEDDPLAWQVDPTKLSDISDSRD